MSVTYQQFLETALSQAQAGIDPLTNPISDTEWIGEDFVTTVFQQVARDCAKDEQKRSLLRKLKTITFVSGQATVTSDVLTEYKEDSQLYDPTDFNKDYSLVREWASFVQPRTGWMLWQGTYSFNGTTIAVVEANANFVPTTGLSADRTLAIPCVPSVPASASTALDVLDELIDNLLVALATALRGQLNDARTKQAA